MRSDEILIEVQDLTVSYPLKEGFFKWSKHTPLKNVSLELRRGETVGIIGRNGVGKSTLLRAIAGIIGPDSGRVTNHGARVALLSLGVGFIANLNGRQNAILSGMLLGLSRREISGRMDAIIEFSGLGEFIDWPLHTYSTGMRARLGFSTAIQIDPDVWLIDEVLSVGDEAFRVKSAAEIRRVIKSEKTVVLVSHSIPLIKQLADRLIWIEQGEIKLSGDVECVVEQYLSAS